MPKDYDDILKQMEFEMRRCSAEAMRRLLELPADKHEFWLPKTDVYETEDDLIVRVEVAGIERESLNVSLSADRRVLSVRGTRMEQHIDGRRKSRYHQLEVYFGTFERDVLLPLSLEVDADGVRAKYREGFLVVTLPKVAKEQTPQSIPVTEVETDAPE